MPEEVQQPPCHDRDRAPDQAWDQQAWERAWERKAWERAWGQKACEQACEQQAWDQLQDPKVFRGALGLQNLLS